jgi:hypothetical protein
MPKKIAKIPEVAEHLTDEQQTLEEPEPVQSLPVKLNKKTGKPLLSDEEKRAIRIENLQRAKKAKEERDAITTTLRRSKKELTHLELERQKQELDLVKKKIDEISSKPMPKKLTRKQVVQEQDDEEDDEDEEEEVIAKPKQTRARRQPTQEVGYSHLVKQTAADQIRQRLENERIKMAMLSIMPSYKFN